MQSVKRFLPVLCLFSWLIAFDTFAGSAVWNLDPTNGDWNTAANWTPETVPNSETDIASFGQSDVTDISVPSIELDSVMFGADASPFTFTVYNPTDVAYLIFWGAGVINNSPVEQTFIDLTSPFSSSIQFRNNATAGDRVTYYSSAGGNAIFFFNSSNAGTATFIVNTSLDFYGAGAETPSAANATIINDRGDTYFSYGGTAANAVITNQHGGQTDVGFGGDAGNATITNEGTMGADGWQSHTYIGGSAGTATITNNPATVEGEKGGYTSYGTTNLSDSPTIISNGSSFADPASAGITFVTGSTGNAILIAHGGTNGGAGGQIVFKGYPGDGDTTRIVMDGNALLDISLHSPPELNIGSLEGDGEVYVGANNLTIGANNLSTEFGGQIQDGGRHNLPGGSITKTGSGTLTLSGASTYTGGTSVNAGVVLVNSMVGSGTGTGTVQVNAGTLGGVGTIFGPVTIGMGSGGGAILQPGFGHNKPVVLTLQSALTFKSDSTYTVNLNTRKPRTDMVVANGVTIEPGAQFNLNSIGDGKLHLGRILKVLSNNLFRTAISGSFANLIDGSTVTVGMNKFQVSYEGGDGNDLTLKVVP
jgi:autotransporter-associated beta strand protein